MNKTAYKRKMIFNTYADNLSNYMHCMDHQVIKVVPGLPPTVADRAYFCPLCYTGFFDSDINTEADNYLTLEHNPPKTLGGKKTQILTCKKCNNSFGTDYDNLVRRLLVTESFLMNDTQMPIETNVKIDDHQVSSLITKKTGAIFIQPVTKSNPRAIEYLNRQINKNVPVRISPNLNAPDWKDYSFGLLKMAYLKAFELFGYFFADLGNGMNMRDVLNKTMEYPCPNNGVIDVNAPEDQLGLAIVREPKELRAIIITQKISFLHNDHKVEKNIPVILPIPYEEGWELLKNYHNYLNTTVNITSERIGIPEPPLQKVEHYYQLFEL